MQTVNFAGSSYNIPNTRGDRPWGGLSDFVIAAASKAISTAGGSFTLLADINFGASFGLVSTYYKSRTASVADAGQFRLAKTDVISWRNNAGGANIDLSKDTSDNLKWNSTKLLLSGAVVNADINAAAAIAYSKLALTGSIVNADLTAGTLTNTAINASAAIAYSKLALTGSIVNADVNASAAIAYSKLALTGSILNADVNASAAIAYTKLALTGTILNADINASAAIAYSKLNLSTSIVNGDIAASTINLTQKVTGTLPVLNGGTGVTTSTGSVANVLSTSPTLVTPILGVAAATSVNFGDTALANYKESTWTPTDGSGASLTLTVTSAKYTRIGNVVHIQTFLSYPVTASGSTAQINGLPITVSGYATARIYSNSGVGYYMRFNDGGTTASIYNSATNAAATNANLSSSQVMLSGIYFV